MKDFLLYYFIQILNNSFLKKFKMPCSFCGTVGHNIRTCIRLLRIHHEEQDPVNTTRAAALVETLTEVIETEEQTNVETEDNNIEEIIMEDNNQDEGVIIRNNNERIIMTARRNLLSIMDDLEVDLLQNNDNPYITPNRSRSPSPQAPLTIQPISDYGYGVIGRSMLLEERMPPGLTRIPSFDDIANLFNGASEEEFNDLPDLIPIENKNLVDCVDKPCSTETCAICLDKLSSVDLFVTRCGHQYHGTCMIQHIKKKDNCPLCRGVLHV